MAVKARLLVGAGVADKAGALAGPGRLLREGAGVGIDMAGEIFEGLSHSDLLGRIKTYIQIKSVA